MSEEIKNKINGNLKHSKVLNHQEVSQGIHSLDLKVGEGGLPARELAYLNGEDGQPSPIRFHESGRTITRDYVRRVDLDLLVDVGDPQRMRPERMYQRALSLYRTKGAYGTVIDTLTNFSSRGFKNDVDDPDIKLFYDTWTKEINFQETVEKIFFDFFRVGLVRTFKLVGKFEPRLKPENFDKVVKQKTQANHYNTDEKLKTLLAYKDVAAAKKIWSKSFIPLKYSILDPRLIEIQGSLLFDQTSTYLKPEAFKELRKLLQNEAALKPEERAFIKSLPNDLLEDVKKNKPVKLPSELVGKCDYRRQDYERFPTPRVVRSFDAMDYKDALVKADFSTLDGITNYILKITVGSDEHPVTDAAQLEAVAKLFDTASKSFDIVYNHTLQIEKITFPEIREILGQEKFGQVNDDLTMSWGVSRALLDGSMQGNARSIETAVKAFAEEINYARRAVKRWIEREYEEVALAMGFTRYPAVRFDENALKDEIMLMTVIQGMIDRRIISYETGIEKLGFDFSTELANMIQERPLVMGGDLGIIGSPYNNKALPPDGPVPTKDQTPSGEETTVTPQDLEDFRKNMEQMLQDGLKTTQQNIQKVQRTPTGTPSEGRPKGRPAKKPTKQTKPNVKPTKPGK